MIFTKSQIESRISHVACRISHIELSQIANRISHITNRKKMHNFKELIVWQKARKIVKDVYLLTKKYPKEELFGLTQQIRRAAVSIPSNIAEGAGRGTDADFAHFLDFANGSACEVETQLYLSLDLEYISQAEFDDVNYKLQDIEKLVFNLKKKLV